MIIIIKNDNPKFSHLIGKNPTSGPKLMKERRGVVCGWYHNDNTYCMNFVDAADEVSYPEYNGQEFEHLAKGAYTSPFLCYKMVKEFMKLYEEHDAVSNNSIEIYSLVSKDSSIELFQKYFTDVKISVENSLYWDKFKSIKVEMNSTFANFCDFLKIFTFYLSLDNENYFIDDSLINEQFKRIQKINAPYFIRYLFKQNFCKNSKKRFDNIKEYINSDKFEFCPYNNLESRIKFIQENVKDSNVYDIGCGEGQYLKRLLSNNLSYTGVDIDEAVLSEAKKRAERTDYKNYRLLDKIPYDDDSVKTVILSEVIEHIELEKMPDFINDVLKLKNIDKIIITTPNYSFNKNYLISGFRHPDHKFEFTKAQLENFVNFLFPNKEVSMFDIGDKVDGEATTHGVIINV